MATGQTQFYDQFNNGDFFDSFEVYDLLPNHRYFIKYFK